MLLPPFRLSMLSHFQYFIDTTFASQIVYYYYFMKWSRLIQCINCSDESSEVTGGRNTNMIIKLEFLCKTNSTLYNSCFATEQDGMLVSRMGPHNLKSSTMYLSVSRVIPDWPLGGKKLLFEKLSVAPVFIQIIDSESVVVACNLFDFWSGEIRPRSLSYARDRQ